MYTSCCTHRVLPVGSAFRSESVFSIWYLTQPSVPVPMPADSDCHAPCDFGAISGGGLHPPSVQLPWHGSSVPILGSINVSLKGVLFDNVTRTLRLGILWPPEEFWALNRYSQ